MVPICLNTVYTVWNLVSWFSGNSLHFVWVVDHEKCIVVTHVCVSVCLSVCVSVCLSAAACPHYCMDPDVTWGSGRGCPLVVHYWADLQSVHRLRCVAMATLWKCMAELSGNLPGPPHAACMPHTHTTHAGEDPLLATKSTWLLCAPFHFVHTAGVL